MTSMTTFDLDAQKSAVDDLLHWYRRVTVTVTGSDGTDVCILEIGKSGIVTRDAPARISTLCLSARGGICGDATTVCRAGLLQLTGPMHVRADAQHQLELVSGGEVVLKVFAPRAEPSDWPHGLRHARVSRVRRLVPLLDAADADSLRSLDASGSPELASLEPIVALGRIESLAVGNCHRTLDLSPLPQLERLRSLDLSSSTTITDFSPLARLPGLVRLELDGCQYLADLAPLAGLERLVRLGLMADLRTRVPLTDLGPLSGLKRLKVLTIAGHRAIEDLGPLAGLRDLRALDASLCFRVRDVSPLAHLSRLGRLDLSGCERLQRVAPLARLPALVDLDVRSCSAVRDLDALRDAPALRRLAFDPPALRDGVLLACAIRRGAPDLGARIEALAGSLRSSTMLQGHAARLVDAIEAAVRGPATDDLARAIASVEAAFRARDEDAFHEGDNVAPATWRRFRAVDSVSASGRRDRPVSP